MSGTWYAIGVDGGNTKTTAVVIERPGKVVGVGNGLCTDIYGSASPSQACSELSRTIEAALQQAQCRSDQLQIGVFSLAGADWPEDYSYLHRYLSTRFSFQFDPIVVNDSIGGLRLGAPNWEGIAVICGTGNAVGARHRDGTFFHLGFWPDPVGAAPLSQAALNAVYRDHLGLGPSTSLTRRALELYEVNDPIELLHRFTRQEDAQRPELVRMSPVLLGEADQGDAVALDIVTAAGRAMGGQGRISAERVALDVTGAKVVMGGGLFHHPTTALEDAVMSEMPGAKASRTTLPPVIGALMIATDLLGQDSDRDDLNRSLQDFTSAQQTTTTTGLST